MIEMVISGGQTGADYGALLGAFAVGLKTGGMAASNWWTEEGPKPELRTFGLVEGGSYQQRTEANILGSDATLVISPLRTSPGTVLTLRKASLHGKPSMLIDRLSLLKDPSVVKETLDWIKANEVRILNVAGNRESRAPGITLAVKDFIKRLV